MLEHFQKLTVAGVPLSNFYTYGKSNGDSTLRETREGSVGVYLSEDFVLYNSSYNLLYVSGPVSMSPLLCLPKNVVLY